MKKRILVLLSAPLAMAAVATGSAQAAPSTHGCALATGTPNAYQSDTSTIGGTSCTMTAAANVNGSGPSYLAAAQSWSISACTPGFDASGNPICTPDPSSTYSSTGSAPAGAPGAIKVGDVVTVTVTNGTIVVGTFSSS